MTTTAFQTLLKQAILVPMGILGLWALVILWQLGKLNEEGQWVLHTGEIIDQTLSIQTSLDDMETGMRGYVFGGRLEFLEPYHAAKPKISPALINLAKIISHNPEQTLRLQALVSGAEKWMKYAQEQISLREKIGDITKDLFLEDNRGKEIMNELQVQISIFLALEHTLLKTRVEDYESTQKELVFLILACTLLLAILLGNFTRRQLRSLSSLYEAAIQTRKQAEESLSQKIDDLQAERGIREIFVSTLTHDLRSPLTSIQMSVQLMLRNPHEANEKFATRILKSSHQANRMIENLLDANRIKAGERLNLNIIALDFLKIVTETIEDLKIIHGPRFTVENSASEFPGYWSADGVRRTLENLCNNAIKYGSAEKPITVKLIERLGQIECSVHNHGNPLSLEEQIKLFEPFQRSRSVQESGKKGWGLGLTLVQGIVVAHGGTVRVESSETSGTTFIINLPNDSRCQNEVGAHLIATTLQ